MALNKNPAFNLKAVLHETGISADTLRAWERRYGLPLPQRTAGGHRLYSQHDIETIKWLIARQAEGLSISRAVDLWQEQTTSGLDPLSNPTPRPFPSPALAVLRPLSTTNLDSLRSHWLAGCLSFNEPDAERALNQAFAIYPIEVVCTEVLQRGLSEIGALWYANRASVQQEHFASALAIRRLDTLLSASPPPTRKQTILVGCPSQEWHTFTPLLLSLLLRRRGLNIIYLGANVPGDRFDETVKSVHAEIVVLAAQQLKTAASLMETAQLLAVRNTTVAYGGRIFTLHDALHRRIPGHYLGANLEQAVVKIESLISNPVKNPPAEAVAREYVTAASAFQAHRPEIEASLNQSIGRLGFGNEVLKTATEFLGDNLTASLRLGQISFMDAEMDWVRMLLEANQIPESALNEYMHFFSEAVKLNLNGSGRPIHEWLAGMIDRPR